MYDMSMNFPLSILPVGAAAVPAEERAAAEELLDRPASCDMVTVSGADSPLRAQLLGYGSVTVRTSGSVTAAEGGGMVSHFRVDNEWEYFDLIHGTVTRTRSTGIGVMYSGDGVEASAFQGTSVRVTFSAADYRPGQLGETIDRLTADHETKRSFLENSLTGEGLKKQLSDLEELYRKGKDETARSFADMLCKLLPRQEQAEEAKDIRNSVQAVFASYEMKYSSISARLGDTWLKGSVYEAAVSLRRLGVSVEAESASAALERLDSYFSQRKLELGVSLRA